MNLVVILGRLTSDPELRQTQSGIASCRFTVAVDRGFKNKQTDERETDFISCIAWRQQAEFISRYWSKGKMIAVFGTLRIPLTALHSPKDKDDLPFFHQPLITAD